MKELFKRVRGDYWMYCVSEGGPRAIRGYLAFTIKWHLYNRVIGRIICKYSSHVLIDNSYAGPDSGVEDMSCTRCGWSFDHIYY